MEQNSGLVHPNHTKSLPILYTDYCSPSIDRQKKWIPLAQDAYGNQHSSWLSRSPSARSRFLHVKAAIGHVNVITIKKISSRRPQKLCTIQNCLTEKI